MGRLASSTSLPLFTGHSFMGIVFPSCSLSHWASSQYYRTTYEFIVFKSFLSPYNLKKQVFTMKVTQKSFRKPLWYAMSFPKAAVLPYSINLMEDQIHSITHMQISRPEEGEPQLPERFLHPTRVPHRPAKIIGDTSTNTEFNSFQKICPIPSPTHLTVVLSPSIQAYSNLPFISLSEKWFQTIVEMPIREYDMLFRQITRHCHVVQAIYHMCTAGKATSQNIQSEILYAKFSIITLYNAASLSVSG